MPLLLPYNFISGIPHDKLFHTYNYNNDFQTLDELDTHPDFQLLLLDKDTAIQQLSQNNSTCNVKTHLSSNEGGGGNKIKKKVFLT